MTNYVLGYRCDTSQIPAGQSPLAETQFWRDRTNALSSLYEQLNSINAKRMLALLDAGSSNSNLLASFRSQVTVLTPLNNNMTSMITGSNMMPEYVDAHKYGTNERFTSDLVKRSAKLKCFMSSNKVEHLINVARRPIFTDVIVNLRLNFFMSSALHL